MRQLRFSPEPPARRPGVSRGGVRVTLADELADEIDDDRTARAFGALVDLRQTHLTRREWC